MGFSPLLNCRLNKTHWAQKNDKFRDFKLVSYGIFTNNVGAAIADMDTSCKTFAYLMGTGFVEYASHRHKQALKYGAAGQEARLETTKNL